MTNFSSKLSDKTHLFDCAKEKLAIETNRSNLGNECDKFESFESVDLINNTDNENTNVVNIFYLKF